MAPTRGRVTHEEAKNDSATRERQANNTHQAHNKPRRAGNTTTTSAPTSKNGSSNQANGNATGMASGTQSESMNGVGLLELSTFVQLQHTDLWLQLDWPSEDLSVLQTYRSAHQLNIPSAFRSSVNAAVLSTPGIGKNSPTMAQKKDKRKINKEQLALAVRKHFNSLAVVDTETISQFFYKAKSNGRLSGSCVDDISFIERILTFRGRKGLSNALCSSLAKWGTNVFRTSCANIPGLIRGNRPRVRGGGCSRGAQGIPRWQSASSGRDSPGMKCTRARHKLSRRCRLRRWTSFCITARSLEDYGVKHIKFPSLSTLKFPQSRQQWQSQDPESL